MAKTKKRQSKKQAQGADILASAHNIWLAGLGAVAAAGEEGERLFKELVERGKGIEVRMAEPMEKAGSSLRGTVQEMGERAKKTLRSIETKVDEQVGAALGKIGVPTRDEVAELSRRIEALNRRIAGGKSSVKKSARKTGSRKRSTKKTTARKSTAKRASKKKATKKAR
jgi:poly(hydroxyalkanoate) granule-associated protein